MALLRELIAQEWIPFAELLQTPIEIDLDGAQQNLLTRALETCAAQHGQQPSLSEITRLIQLLDARQSNSQPSHIEVRWVDPPNFNEPR